jgi:cytochrome P450
MHRLNNTVATPTDVPLREWPFDGPGLFGRIFDLYRFWSNPFDMLLQYASRYGDVMNLDQDTVFLNHPDLVRDLFTTNASKHLRGPGLDSFKRIFGDGLVSSEDPLHLEQRHILQPVFQRDRIAEYAASMVHYANRMCQEWQPGQTIDVHEEMTKVTLAIACKTLLDADIFGEDSDLASSVSELMEAFLHPLPFGTYLEKLPFSFTRGLQNSLAEFDRVIYRKINARRTDTQERGDVLSMLLRAQAVGGNHESDRQIRDHCATLIAAGHETTASAATFALYLLAKHPVVASNLYAELETVIRGPLPSPEDFPNLIYTRMVFAETMRLYPPICAVARTVKEEYSLMGRLLPVGTVVQACPFTMHRDPRFFTDPERFDPERFSASGQAGRPKYSYFPFGGGSRYCIGDSFAWMEGVLLLATIFQRWRMNLATREEMQLQPSISLRPKRAVLVTLSRS